MYSSDLTDEQWHRLEGLVKKHGPSPQLGGRPRIHALREVVNAILYVHHTGCQWRSLPKDFPPWETAYGVFRRWRLSGLWDRLWKALREEARRNARRSAEPTVAIIDSPSVKTTLKRGRVVTTPTRKPKGASAASRSTRKAGGSR